MADDPICFVSKGSSNSLKLANKRMSVQILCAEEPKEANTLKTLRSFFFKVNSFKNIIKYILLLLYVSFSCISLSTQHKGLFKSSHFCNYLIKSFYFFMIVIE